MLNDKQSLMLCGLLVVGVFVAGILGVFNNFIVLTVFTIIFLTIIMNLFLSNSESEDDEKIDIN